MKESGKDGRMPASPRERGRERGWTDIAAGAAAQPKTKTKTKTETETQARIVHDAPWIFTAMIMTRRTQKLVLTHCEYENTTAPLCLRDCLCRRTVALFRFVWSFSSSSPLLLDLSAYRFRTISGRAREKMVWVLFNHLQDHCRCKSVQLKASLRVWFMSK